MTAFVNPGTTSGGIRPRLYTCAAAGAASYVPLLGTNGQFERQVGMGVDPKKYDWIVVDYPGAHQAWDQQGLSAVLSGNITIAQDVAVGKNAVMSQIFTYAGPFAFCGYSLGAAVLSEVYKEIQSGVLQYRQADFLGAVTFGNSMRQQGHSIPGQSDPGGMGCFGPKYALTNSPTNWWDFVHTSPSDLFTTTDPSTAAGQLEIAVADLVLSNFGGQAFNTFTAFLWQQLSTLGAEADVIATYEALAEFMSWNPNVNTTGHGMYADPYPGVPGNSKSAVQLGIDFLNSLTAQVVTDRVGQLDQIETLALSRRNTEIGGTTG